MLFIFYFKLLWDFFYGFARKVYAKCIIEK